MYIGTTLRLNRIEPTLAELCFDRQGGSVNKLDQLAIDELRAALAALRAAPGLEGLLITSARNDFIVGADIFEFRTTFGEGAAALADRVAGVNAVFNTLEALEMPTVCALQGAALGGGLELALAADWRVMADDAMVGLPEVKLGLMPGYGGTVRLARIAGTACALEWIASGAPRRAAAALEAGAVDRVAAGPALRTTALALLREAVDGRLDWRARRARRQGPADAAPEAVETARQVAGKGKALYPAAAAAIEQIAAAAPLGRDAALALETRAFVALAQGQTAGSLIGLFVDEQAVRKAARAHAAAARPVRRAAILGAGIMGGGIAYQSALRGVPATLKDIAQPALDVGMREADKLLDKQVANGRLTRARADEVRSAITPQLDYAGFDAADIVIEAVVENLHVKKAVLAEIEAVCRPDAVLASNTSSLSIAALAEGRRNPRNVVGMHFFNPVPAMALVEVIPGPQTSAETLATTVAYASAMGKTPVVVQDCPGFLINRILTAYLLGFGGLVRDGADIGQVDAALEAFGWPMGPAYLQDVIGMDTTRHMLEIVAAGFPDRMLGGEQPSAVLADLGRLGQKNGVGFYRYERDAKGKPGKLPAGDLNAVLAPLRPGGVRAFGTQEIVDRTMLPMLIEAAWCLETGVVASASELDLALVLGLGFPRYLGGALRYMDHVGLAAIVARCDALAGLGPLYAPTARMRAMAASGARYHDTAGAPA